jgi:hypothetical protein
MIKSGGIPSLRVQAGRIGPIEAIFKGSYEVFGLNSVISVKHQNDRIEYKAAFSIWLFDGYFPMH